VLGAMTVMTAAGAALIAFIISAPERSAIRLVAEAQRQDLIAGLLAGELTRRDRRVDALITWFDIVPDQDGCAHWGGTAFPVTSPSVASRVEPNAMQR
jgi:hypothetical protein